jgi:DNA-binding CsgD family transcriptional regulator
MSARPITPNEIAYRERIIVEMRKEGHPNSDMARRLGIDPRTVSRIVKAAIADGRLPPGSGNAYGRR